MDAIKAFNEELSGIYETKPPISRAKMTILTKKAIKGIKFYKHIVQSIEKFIQKCRPEYKVPGLYVMDSVVRQSRHQFGPEKDVFMPRLCKNILTTFQHIYKCPQEDKPRVLRVLNLWQKNTVFPQDIVQQLLVMGGAPTPGPNADAAGDKMQRASNASTTDTANLTNMLANLIANPDAGKIQSLAGLLSSSQQNQLQELLKQVKGNEQVDVVEIEEEVVEEYMDTDHQGDQLAGNIQKSLNSNPTFQALAQSTSQPPFLMSQAPNQNRPSFNRAVLDYDYSDDEQTPPNNGKLNHQPGIDPTLLAKLPTVDQIHQLTSSNGSLPHRLNPEEERRRRLEEEQENFNKQIQEIPGLPNRSDNSRDNRRRLSRSRSRDKDRRHHRRGSPSHDRGHRSRRSRSRSRDRSGRRSRRSRSRSRERRRATDKGLPPVREGFYSVCTTTLWIGNISSKVMQHELQGLVEEYGKVDSINMIPPRGCAYICMKDRAEASKALYKIRHARMGGKSLKCDWAPSKEMPEDQKSTWVKEHGVNYVPHSIDSSLFRLLTLWGFVDPDSVPPERKAEFASITDSNPEVKPEMMMPLTSVAAAPAMLGHMPPGARFGMVPGMPMPGRQSVPMLVRPGFSVAGMAQFGVPQRLGIPPEANQELKDGELTPTKDEHSEESSSQQQQPHFPPSFAPASMAQRFPGQVPLIRMMPGMMQPRMGVMPIRMGVPMQLRPGFHPAMQRMQFPGAQGMMAANAMPPQLRAMHQLPPQGAPGFPGGMQLRVMPPQADAPPSVGSLTTPSPVSLAPPLRPTMLEQEVLERDSDERKEDMLDADSLHLKRNPDQEVILPTGRPDDFPHPREFDRPPHDFNQQRSFENERPPDLGGRPPFERGDRDFDRERRFDRGRNFDRGFNRDRFPRDRDAEWGARGRGRGGGDRRNFDRDRRDRGRDFDRDRYGPPRDFDRRDRGGGRGPPWGGPRGSGDDRGWRGRGGGPRSWGRDRRSPDREEEEEYQRRRQETMRKRREEDGSEMMSEQTKALPSRSGDAVKEEGGAEKPAEERRKTRWSSPTENRQEAEIKQEILDVKPDQPPNYDVTNQAPPEPIPPPSEDVAEEFTDKLYDATEPLPPSPGTPICDEQAKVDSTDFKIPSPTTDDNHRSFDYENPAIEKEHVNDDIAPPMDETS